MKGNRWIQLGLIAAVILLAAVAVAVFAFNRPLGPALDLDDPGTAVAQARPIATSRPEQEPTEPAQPEAPAPASPGDANVVAAEPSAVCGQTGQVNLLMLGQNPQLRLPRGADGIRLIVIDYDAPAIKMLALPPDLWVKTSRLGGVAAATLTEAFGLAEESAQSSGQDGVIHPVGVVAQALLDNFGYSTDKYLTLDQSAFKQVIDTVGSIEVFVPEAVDGAPDGYGFYEAGFQAMSGQRALDYVRLLQPAGQPSDEWARFERQNQVIKGIQDEILKPENWDQLPKFVNDFYDLLATNLSPRELLNLNCLLDATGGDVRLFEVSPDMIRAGLDGELIPDETALRDLIAELTAEISP